MRRMITALVLSLAAVLLAPGVAEADARVIVAQHDSYCLNQSVFLRNDTAGTVDVKIYQDGVQAVPASGWHALAPGRSGFALPRPAPGAAGVIQVFERADDGSEVLAATTTYVRQAACDTVEATITENCGQVRVEGYNGHTSAVRFFATRNLIGGSTSPIALVTLAPGESFDQTFTIPGDWRDVAAGFELIGVNTTYYLLTRALTRTCVLPPTVTITTPAAGATYVLGSSVVADYACAPGTPASAIVTCEGTVADGAPIDTLAVGSHEFEVTATDLAGRTGSATSSYDVVYDWTGFFSPIDAAPVVNTTKAGSAVPVKFRLGGDQGLDVLATGSPSSRVVPCEGGTPSDELEQTSTAGSSGLSYDATSAMYTYVWKTQKTWAKTCRQLVVSLADGTTHTASFSFK